MVSNTTPQYRDDPFPKSPKRKRDAIALQPSRLQTTNLNTPTSKNFNDATFEDTLSPRAAVSAKMQGLHLRTTPSPTRRASAGPPWTEDLESRSRPSQLLQGDSHTVHEASDPSTSSFEIAESSQDVDKVSLDHDMQHGIFEFKAGGGIEVASRFGTASPFKRAAFVDDDDEVLNLSSPMKRQRRQSPSISPSPQALPNSSSPSARRLSHRSPPPPSDMSSSPGEAELSHFWWQPSEIVGHDPDDPEDDNRGVNGIGYQKTRAEQWRISEKKKRQIAEWRLREAKEARSLRAGGRRVIMGRVSKPGSRAGSPSDSTARGRSSPAPRSVSDEKRMEEVVRRAVRFELG